MRWFFLLLCGCTTVVSPSSPSSPSLPISEEIVVDEGREMVVQEKSIPGHRSKPLRGQNRDSSALSPYLRELKKALGLSGSGGFEDLLERGTKQRVNVDKDTLMRRAEEAMKAKRYSDAVSIYLEILRADPWDKKALEGYQKASRLARRRLIFPVPKPVPATPPQKKPVSSTKSVSSPVAKQPSFLTSLQSLFDKAEDAYRDGRWDEAELLYLQLLNEAVTSTDPKSPFFYQVAKERIKELSKRRKERQP